MGGRGSGRPTSEESILRKLAPIVIKSSGENNNLVNTTSAGSAPSA